MLTPLIAMLTTFASADDAVTAMNNELVDAIRAHRTAPPVASRQLAMLHVAQYDAVNGLLRTHAPYLVAPSGPFGASPEAAAAAAGRVVLSALYPADAPVFEAAEATQLAAVADGWAEDAGVLWGETVAAEILALRANDGSSAVVPYTPSGLPGRWAPTAPAFAAPALPQWPYVDTWAIPSGDAFRAPPPPDLTSAEYAANLLLTEDLGAINSTSRTADQTQVAHFWADGAGTCTPPGHWFLIAQDVSDAEAFDLPTRARLFALLGMAVADAAISSWDNKYHYDHVRPITGIREHAAVDGNPATIADPAWTPLLVTPPFPEYTSGHSTFSGAASQVLARFVGSDAHPFITTAEDGPFAGSARAFSSFSEAANEAGMSRIYGGIHWMHGNTAGLAGGRAVGDWVVDNYLRRDGLVHRNGSSYVFVNESVPYRTQHGTLGAAERCRAMGMGLLRVNSASEGRFVWETAFNTGVGHGLLNSDFWAGVVPSRPAPAGSALTFVWAPSWSWANLRLAPPNHYLKFVCEQNGEILP